MPSIGKTPEPRAHPRALRPFRFYLPVRPPAPIMRPRKNRPPPEAAPFSTPIERPLPMTMMISKFNRLISSRILWGVILVIIILSFVVWGMRWPSDIAKMEAANAAGELDGQKVPASEYQAAYSATYLAHVLRYGRNGLGTPEADARLRHGTWQRVASLRAANRLGLTVSQDEILASIRNSFSDGQGNYLPDQYQYFATQTLPSLGFSEGQFEMFIRQELLLSKLGILVGGQALVSPLETRRMYGILFDSYQIQYARITPADLPAEPVAGESDARALYDAAPEAFELPEMREIAAVAFPYANYASDDPVPDGEIQDYYDIHVRDYTTTVTNEAGETSTRIADLAEVRDGISAILAQARAREAAEAAASAFAYSLIPDNDGNIPDFDAVAADAGLSVTALEPFAADANPIPDAGYPAVRTAFELVLNPYDRVSAPVNGAEASHVLYLRRILAPRVPDFDECHDQALAAALDKARSDALDARAAEISAVASESLAQGKTFADALESFGLSPVTPAPFTGLSASSAGDPELQTIVQNVVSCNQGEISKPIPVPEGRILACVQTLTPADPADYETYRAQINRDVRGMRAMSLFSAWQEDLLSPERFRDFRDAASIDDGDDGADAPAAPRDPSAPTAEDYGSVL